MFNPSGDRGVRIYQLQSSQPHDRHHDRMERYRLGVQRVIVDARGSLLAAAVRRRHFHLTALVLHHPAAGAFLSAHLRVRNHAGHSWSQAGYQQQDQHTELVENTHYLTKSTSSQLRRANAIRSSPSGHGTSKALRSSRKLRRPYVPVHIKNDGLLRRLNSVA